MVDKFLDLLYKYSDYNMHLDETLQALTDYNLTNYNRDYRRRLSLWGTGKRNVESHIRRKRPSHYFDSSRWLRRGLGSFFIYRYEKKDREQEKQRTIVERQRESRQEQIVRHGNTLISQYNDFVQRNPREKKSDWDECLKKFQFRKEFLQHLLTGHEKLYDLLNDAMTSGKKSNETYNSVFGVVRYRIRKEAREMGIVENPKENELMFAELDVVRFVLNEIDFLSWEGFVAKDDPHLGRIIETGEKVFSLNYFDWGQVACV